MVKILLSKDNFFMNWGIFSSQPIDIICHYHIYCRFIRFKLLSPPMSEPLLPKDVKFEDDHLKKIFLEQVNGIYFGKQHLLEFFKEVEEIANIKQLKLAIDE